MMLPLVAGVVLLVQVQPYQRPLPPWVPPASAPVSKPSLLINPPPATWQGQWRPEYGTMIMKPWEAK